MGRRNSISIFMIFISIIYCLTVKAEGGESAGKQPAVPETTQNPAFIEMVFVEGGSFDMGSDDGAPVERPVHNVRVNDFYMSRFEVTQSRWFEIMAAMPGTAKGSGDRYPAYNMTWAEAADFCNRLSIREGLTPCYGGSGAGIECDFSANGYRLPTEAEWEYAARGGKLSRGRLYAGTDNENEAGWYNANSDAASHEAGLKAANELGLYDMSGNVWEWCNDWYAARYYDSSPSDNPTGPESGMYRILRGGGWGLNEYGMRNTNRYYGAHRSDNSYGFRIVRKAN